MAVDAHDDVIVDEDGTSRCWWPGTHEGYVAYHDTEWGEVVHDDVRLFEKLCLEGFQSGLSWLTILRKRPRFREVFDGFDPVVVARYGEDDIAGLLGDPGIIRHRGKIEATIANARATLDIQDRHGSLDAFVWGFAPADPRPRPRSRADIPATTTESTALAKALKGQGFRFVGPTTAYAFMQSMGMVNDHLAGCDFG
ncbi:DNA-3-methyladenine glycosylase [Euzebya pacifica]|uniref:DNA-3-methyladenine glycosylase n=1 Tax=Euzebya pacifica TaxID=1608957 RepID=A0A346XZA8_9ACTN|nr:DNA-3-methyladenine glycosylase I [Euzebya pacifica]AXV07555.1 DNA-3-methyladenine glycosylase [Euzebya pacifica]